MSETIAIDPELVAQDIDLCAYALPILDELSRRLSHPYFRYTPDDQKERDQLGFHRSQAPTRIVFGGNHGGKSKAVSEEIKWWLCGDHPYQQTPRAPAIYVVSAMYLTIETGIWSHLKEILPDWKIEKFGPPVPNHNFPQYVLMKDGGKVTFISGKGIKEARKKVQAARLHLVVVDEEVAGSIWLELGARLLAHGGRRIFSGTAVESEPWLLDLEDRALMGEPDIDLFRFDAEAAARKGHISQKTLAEQRQSYSDEEAEVRIKGMTRRSHGIVYPEFGKEHICAPFQIPKSWTRRCAIDPGGRCWAALWIATSPAGKRYRYRELYYFGGKLVEFTNAIHAAEGWRWDPKRRIWQWNEDVEEILVRWGDPGPLQTQASPEYAREYTLGHLLSQHPYCLPCSPAFNDVEPGIELVRLGWRTGFDGKPESYVFSTLTNYLGEIRQYRREKDSDPSKPERPAKPFKRRDHLVDCDRYLHLGGLDYIPRDDRRRTREEFRAEVPLTGNPILDKGTREMWERRLEAERHVSSGQNLGGLGSEW